MKTCLKLASLLVVCELLAGPPVARGQTLLPRGPADSSMSNTEKGVLGGAGIGAVAGGLIGAADKSPAVGAAIGAGLGGLSGGLIGNNMDQRKARRQEQGLGLTDVVQMTQQGVPEAQIIRAIAQSRSTFDLSPRDLIYLRQQHVGDRVVEAMQAGPGTGGLARDSRSDLVADLVAILDQTQSADTLLVTAETLMSMKADAKRVLPALIRNAERLKLFKGMANNKARPFRQKAVLDAIDFFTKRAHVVVVKKKAKQKNTDPTVY